MRKRMENMFANRCSSFLLIAFLAAALAGCAGGGKAKTVAAGAAAGGGVVTIEASSYHFTPSEIRVEKPGLLPLEIKNVSGSVHNFTVKDPAGKEIKSVDIRPHSSVITNLELPGPGTYSFHCNKKFHTTMGMKGRIIVGAAK